MRKKLVRFNLTTTRKLSSTEETEKGHAISVSHRNNNQYKLSKLKVAIVLSSTVTLLHIRSVDYFPKRDIPAPVKYDYSSVEGIDELKARSDKILTTDLCKHETKNVCTCQDPTTASSREGRTHWSKTLNEHVDAITQRTDDIDVVFYGDSIIEGWMGTSYGFLNGRKEFNYQVFQSLFTLEGGGNYKGLALGISGDTSQNLLWRLQHGELPSSLNPKVFWILIGMNDLKVHRCTPEVTLMGIVRVVEEILSKKTDSVVVINGILPSIAEQKQGPKSLSNHDLRKNLLWKEIQEINEELQKYSNNRERVEFFNIPELFLKDNGIHINTERMSDLVHPSSQGYKAWGDEIVEKLDQLSLFQ